MIRVTHARYFITVPGLEPSSSQGTVPRWEQSIEFQGWSETTFQVAILGSVRDQRRPTLVNPTTLGVIRVRQRLPRVTPALQDEQSTLVVIARTTVVQKTKLSALLYHCGTVRLRGLEIVLRTGSVVVVTNVWVFGPWHLFVYNILFSHTSCRVCGVVSQIFYPTIP